MKTICLLLLLIFSLSAAKAQSLKIIENKLCESFSKIDYYGSARFANDDYNKDTDDSLDIANKQFEKLLLRYTKRNPETIFYHFKKMSKKAIVIITSKDSLFRIYSWNTNEGGSMKMFDVVFQYKDRCGIHSFPAKFMKENKDEERDDYGCSFYQMDDIIINGKTYYIVQSIIVASSALYGYTINIFTINDSGLTDRTNLFKTKTGFVSEIGYAFDLSSISNSNIDIGNFDLEIHYDKVHKIISFPATDGDKIYNYRIRYKFNGQYFEKM